MLRAMKKVQIINQKARQHNIQKNGFNLLELLTVIVILMLVPLQFNFSTTHGTGQS